MITLSEIAYSDAIVTLGSSLYVPMYHLSIFKTHLTVIGYSKTQGPWWEGGGGISSDGDDRRIFGGGLKFSILGFFFGYDNSASIFLV